MRPLTLNSITDMKKIHTLLFISLLLFVASCGSRDHAEPPLTHSSSPAPPEPTPLPDVLTADDMETLSESRPELINRDTPLGEEHDAVLELQNRHN